MKSFSNSFLNDYDKLKNAVIGFEFEFYSKINYPQTLEVLNRELSSMDIKVWGFKQYHSTFEVDATNFKLEPDLSGGFNLCELVTGPMPYVTARLVFGKIMRVLQKHTYTTDRCGLHVNISFPTASGKTLDKLNIIKLILNMDESRVYADFPDRVDNVYAKSIKSIIPFKDYDYTNSSINVLNNSLMLPNTKYYGINFGVMVDGRLEYRYVGGENYQFKVNEILDIADYFVMLTWNSIGEQLTDTETTSLRKYLEENIRKYKSLNKLENFMAQFPSVELQIDKQNDFEMVNAYYNFLYEDVYQLVNYSKGLRNCIINYDTETKLVEVVGANIEFLGSVSALDFIDCKLITADLSSCNVVQCEVESSILLETSIVDSVVNESKLLGCKVDEYSEIADCYFTEGYMNGYMNGGVFRSGTVGELGRISEETKILNDEQNFFGINIKGAGGIDKGKKGMYFPKKK
jgi:hypothetical protein